MKTKMKKVAASSPVAKRNKVDFKEHMKGMPEFNQPEIAPIKQLLVNFATKEDMHKFSKLIGQAITMQTVQVFYPELKEEPAMDKRWTR